MSPSQAIWLAKLQISKGMGVVLHPRSLFIKQSQNYSQGMLRRRGGGFSGSLRRRTGTSSAGAKSASGSSSPSLRPHVLHLGCGSFASSFHNLLLLKSFDLPSWLTVESACNQAGLLLASSQASCENQAQPFRRQNLCTKGICTVRCSVAQHLPILTVCAVRRLLTPQAPKLSMGLDLQG